MSNTKMSFTSADTVPVKLIQRLTELGAQRMSSSRLRPLHIQWIPTNRCNLNCHFCSCSERDKGLTMVTDKALDVISEFATLGTEAVTITGGGEPLLHPNLSVMIHLFHSFGIKVGLVTNGTMLQLADGRMLDQLTWCRISHSDDRRTSRDGYLDRLSSVVRKHREVDWAFSYVVTKEPNLNKLDDIIHFAAHHRFTHVRLVGDLLEPTAIPWIDVKEIIPPSLQDLVIIQPRKEQRPQTTCLVGYVKPLIAPDFSMYLCCGVQYALKERSLDLPPELRLGSALELDDVYNSTLPVSVPCERCYYTEYNDMLRCLQDPIEHKEFV